MGGLIPTEKPPDRGLYMAIRGAYNSAIKYNHFFHLPSFDYVQAYSSLYTYLFPSQDDDDDDELDEGSLAIWFPKVFGTEWVQSFR